VPFSSGWISEYASREWSSIIEWTPSETIIASTEVTGSACHLRRHIDDRSLQVHH
jgi:hypothetical protein